jgi:hypothetical protein
MQTTFWAVAVLLAAPAAWATAMSQDAPAAPTEHAAPAPPGNLVAKDHPWDGGTMIDLSWDISPDDARLESYQVLRAVASIGGEAIEPVFTHVDFVEPGAVRKPATQRIDYVARDLRPAMDIYDVRKYHKADVDLAALEASGVKRFSVGYQFQVVAVAADGSNSEPVTTAEALVPGVSWFDGGRLSLLVIMVIFCGAVVFWINHARQGKPVNVRKIAGLEAVDEAVGRATEMGRTCMFIPGIQDMNDIQTIAGITVLARVAKTAAEYDAKVEVPTARSLVMTAARETVQAAFLEAGRPEAFNDDLIYYVTDEQFGYVAYLQGMMVREKPAACFYMGHFFAESLILAETGNSIGAIQVAGTAAPAQLPFFVAACDYTLIGEEFFAASAYLSGSPEQLGSLKGQDMGKLIVGALLILGVAAATLAAAIPESPFSLMMQQAVDFLESVILT